MRLVYLPGGVEGRGGRSRRKTENRGEMRGKGIGSPIRTQRIASVEIMRENATVETTGKK